MNEILRRLLSFLAATLLFVWVAVVIMAGFNPDPDSKRLILTVAFSLLVVLGIIGIICLMVLGAIPGLNNRQRRGLIYGATIGTLMTTLAILAMWNVVLIPFWGIIVLIIIGMVVLLVVDIVLSYYALR